MKKWGLVIRVQKGGPRSTTEVWRCGLPSRATFQEILLIRINKSNSSQNLKKGCWVFLWFRRIQLQENQERKAPPPLFLFLYVRNSAHGSEFAPVKKLHTLSALGDREFRLLFPPLGLAARMKDYLLESRLYPRVLFLIWSQSILLLLPKGINVIRPLPFLHEGTGQRETIKYLRESYYHCIEYSVVNSLIALMRKWYLNSDFQPYSYSQRLQEGADGTRITSVT